MYNVSKVHGLLFACMCEHSWSMVMTSLGLHVNGQQSDQGGTEELSTALTLC